MRHRKDNVWVLIRVTGLLTIGGACALGGCDKPAPPPPPPAAPAPVQTPAPQQASLESVELDPRVQFPEERLPYDQALAEAVGTLASAIARGDDEAMSRLLDPPAEAVLAELVERGEWESQTKGIELVRIVALEGAEADAKVGLAVQDPKGAYLMAWEGRRAGDAWIFTGLATTEQTAARASDLDGVALSEEAVPEPQPEVAEAPADPDGRRDEAGQPSRRRSGGGGPGRPGRPGRPGGPSPGG